MAATTIVSFVDTAISQIRIEPLTYSLSYIRTTLRFPTVRLWESVFQTDGTRLVTTVHRET